MNCTYIDLKTGRSALPPAALAGLDLGVLGMSAYHAPRLGTPERVRLDTEAIKQAAIGIRQDAVTSSAGTLAMQLNARRKAILEEKKPLLSSFSMFQLDPFQPPPGAKTHSVPYSFTHGEAALYRGGDRIPQVGGSVGEDIFNIWPLVTSFQENYFEAQSQAFAGYDPRARDVATCRQVLDETANRINWYGDSAAGLYGALTYPRTHKRIEATAFDGTASAVDVLAALNSGANYTATTSREVFRPNRCAASPRVQRYLSQTRLGSVDSVTIAEFFLKGQPGIKSIESAWELMEPPIPGAGAGNGIDAILFWNDDPENVSLIVPQGVTMLPPYTIGLGTTTICVMLVGGLVMGRPGSALLMLVTAPAD